MKTLKLSELIGQEIVDLKFHYIPENEYGLQSFQSYIKLENGIIIDIPKFDDDDFLNLSQENLNYYSSMFDSGKTLNSNTSRALVVGQKIVDFYFCYYENEVDFDFSAFIKLSNNYYLSENNFGPVGITNVDLIIFNEKQFMNEIDRLKKVNINVNSFLKQH